MVVKVEDDLIEVVKAKKGKTGGTKYRVNTKNIYKALPDMDSLVVNGEQNTEEEKLLDDQDEHSDIQEICFYCRKCKYLKRRIALGTNRLKQKFQYPTLKTNRMRVSQNTNGRM